MPTSTRSSRLSSFFINLANIYRFVSRALRSAVLPPYETKELLRQSYQIGVRTFALVTFTAFIAGIVFTRQSRPSLQEFGAESWLPSLVSIAIVRSLGPLITGLICAGRVGSSIGAELSSMKVTEQIDAMEVSGTRPFHYLVVSRVTGAALMVPILVIYADFVGLLGSFVATNYFSQTSFALYWAQALSSLSLLDLFSSFGKGVLYGLAIGLVSCYTGYNSAGGTVGVGKAANTAVVTSMFLIFILDLIALQIFEFFRAL
ncbi:MAG: ABC transporter permease [Bacteroidetes bacterium]|nr:ABC transporter permease [Bacteroidota bacterium]